MEKLLEKMEMWITGLKQCHSFQIIFKCYKMIQNYFTVCLLWDKRLDSFPLVDTLGHELHDAWQSVWGQ